MANDISCKLIRVISEIRSRVDLPDESTLEKFFYWSVRPGNIAYIGASSECAYGCNLGSDERVRKQHLSHRIDPEYYSSAVWSNHERATIEFCERD